MRVKEEMRRVEEKKKREYEKGIEKEKRRIEI